MLKIILLALLLTSNLTEAKSSHGGSGRSYYSGRSYSRPSTPSPPRPLVNRTTNNHTTVVHQTVIQQNHTTSSGGGMGFLGTIAATGLGSYLGNKLAQPSEQPQAPQQSPQPQYPVCPKVVPVGYNTPCIPQP